MNAWTDTNVLIDKVGGLLPALEARGTVCLFALAERDDVERWDVVLSAEWSDANEEDAVGFVVTRLRSRLEPQEMTLISRIAIIPSNDPRVQDLTKRLAHIAPQDHLVVPSRMIYGELLGSGVRHAFVFKAQRIPESAIGARLSEAAAHS